MTLRSNGSYIGLRPTGPSNSAASGIWDLRTAERQKRANAWPSPVVGLTPNTDNRFRVIAAADTTSLTAGVETTTTYWKMVSSTGQASSVRGNGYYYNYYQDPWIGTISGMPTGEEKTVEIFSCDASGNPSGQIKFVSFHRSSQSITAVDASGCSSLQGFRVSSSSAPNSPFSTGYTMSSTLPATITEVRAVGVAGSGGTYSSNSFFRGINVEGQSLSAAALNQLYTDLSSGSAKIFVAGNPGTSGDDPTIATAKGYTVFGS